MRKLEKEKIAKSVGVDVLGDPSSRGITLIALIITIIVMLILVAVTITVALDSGLFGTGKKAAYQTEVREVQEQLEIAKAVKVADNGGKKPSDFGITINDLPISDDLKSKYGTKLIISKDGTLYYDGEVVTDQDERGWLEEIEIYEYTGEEAGIFEEYVLGGTPGQKNLQTIFNMDTMTFIDEEGTIPDASTTVSFLSTAANEDSTKGYIYAIYEKVAYKIICDADTYMTENVEEIYRPQSELEGKDLGAETGDSQYNGWTIIYDHGNGTVEAVSPDVMKEEGTTGLTLGSGDETAQTPGDIDGNGTPNESIDKAIYSYNNAITRINDYCKNLEGLPTNIGVRSVGTATDPRPNLEGSNAYNGIPSEWSTSATYNGKGKAGDTAYEQDLVRMGYHGVADVDEEYWVASRNVGSGSGSVYFYVACVNSDGLFNNNLWYVYSSSASDDSPSRAVRPIITVQIPQS